MSLSVVTGRANTGRTGLLLGAARAAASRGEVPTIIVAQEADATSASREMGCASPLGVRVTTFHGYLASLWTLYGDGRRIVSPTQRLQLLRHAIAAQDLRAVGAIAARPGFERTLAWVIRSAAEQGFCMGRAGQARAGSTPHSADVMTALASYASLLEQQRLVEPGEALRNLGAAAGSIAWDGPLIVYGLTDLTAAEEAFVAGCADAGREVLVGLPFDPQTPATRSSGALVGRLSAHGAQTAAPTDTTFNTHPELAALEKWLGQGYRGLRPQGAVVLCEGVGEEKEIELAVAQAAQARGLAGEEASIAIVAPDVAARLGYLRRALADAGLDFDIDARLPLLVSGFGRAVTYLLRSHLRGGNWSDLMMFLRTPYSGAEREAVDRLDVSLRGDRISCDMSISERAAKALGGRTARMLRQFAELAALPFDAAAADRWRRLFDELYASAYAAADVVEARQLAVLDAAAHRALISAVSELSGLENERLTARDLFDIVEGLQLELAPTRTAGTVHVVDLERAHTRRFHTVILLGMTAGTFPRSGQSDMLRTDLLGSVLESQGIAQTEPTGLEHERLLFYQVVTRATHQLVLVRQSGSDEAVVRRPSIFWEEVVDLYREPGSEAESDDDTIPVVRTVAAPAGLSREGRRAGGLRTEVGEEVLAKLADRMIFSVSELERYIKCPYLWFSAQIAGSMPIDGEMGAMQLGTLAHAALSLFYEALPDRLGFDRVRPENLAACISLLEEVFDGLPLAAETVNRRESGAVSEVRQRLVDLVTKDATFLAGYVPMTHEWRFGFGDEPAADFDGFSLRGSVDRIDRGPQGAVVIDYKSGAAHQHAVFAREGIVQAPLYVRAVQQRMGVDVVGALYRSVKDGVTRGAYIGGVVPGRGLCENDALDAESFGAVLDDAEERARTAVAGIRAGIIEPEPLNTTCCRYCLVRSMCQRSTS